MMSEDEMSSVLAAELSDDEILKLMTFKTKKATYFINDIQSFSSEDGTSYVNLKDGSQLVAMSDEVLGRLKLQKAKADLYISTVSSAKNAELALKREFVSDVLEVVKDSLAAPAATLASAESAIIKTQHALESTIEKLPELIKAPLASISDELSSIQRDLDAASAEAISTTAQLAESAMKMNKKAEAVTAVVETFERFIDEVADA